MMLKNSIIVSTKILGSTTVFNSGNKKCSLSSKSANQNDFWRISWMLHVPVKLHHYSQHNHTSLPAPCFHSLVIKGFTYINSKLVNVHISVDMTSLMEMLLYNGLTSMSEHIHTADNSCPSFSLCRHNLLFVGDLFLFSWNKTWQWKCMCCSCVLLCVERCAIYTFQHQSHI